MRPPPIGGGFNTCCASVILSRSSFNEAAADWRRIRHAAMVSRAIPTGFNEAAADWRRIPKSTSGREASATCFNEAAADWRRILADVNQLASRPLASMRPPPIGGGFPTVGVLHPLQRRASMRPPPIGGGFADRRGGAADAEHASMRPPPIGGGFADRRGGAADAEHASMRPPPIGGGFVRAPYLTALQAACFNEAAADWRRIRASPPRTP